MYQTTRLWRWSRSQCQTFLKFGANHRNNAAYELWISAQPSTTSIATLHMLGLCVPVAETNQRTRVQTRLARGP